MDEPFSLQSIRCRAPAFRRRAAAVLGTLIFIFCMAAPAYAAVSSAGSVSGQSRTLVPLGRAVGVKLFSDGLLVVNLSESVTEDGTASPARQCGIRTGDVLLELNDEDLKSTEQLQTALQKNGAQPLCSLTGDIHLHTLVCPDEARKARVLAALEEKGYLMGLEK